MAVKSRTVANTTSTLKERVAERIKSKAFSVSSRVGKAQMFDITNKDGKDYTLGGMLHGFWFTNVPERVEMARAKGYHFPEEFDPELTNITFGNLVLMLQTDEARVDYREKLEMRNKAQEASQMQNHKRADKYMAFEDGVVGPN